MVKNHCFKQSAAEMNVCSMITPKDVISYL